MLRLSAHVGYLFTDRPFESRFEAARRSGFAAVEHPAPYSVAPRALAATLRQNDLVFVQLAAVGENRDTAKGLAGLPGREHEFRVALDRALDYAAETGCTMVHAMSGFVPDDVDRADAWKTYVENLRYAAIRASEGGIRILIEPISLQTAPRYFMCSPELALRALAEVSDPNLGILFDVFHSVANGTDPLGFLKAYRDLVCHIHVADFPDRHEPGTGSIPFDRVFSVLAEIGYTGYVGCEYVPKRQTESGLGWRATFTNVTSLT